MPSLKTTLVIWLYLVSISTANPTHGIGELHSVAAKDTHLLHGSESQITSSTNGKLCSSSDRLCKLHRRTHDLTEARTVKKAKRTDLKKRVKIRPTSFKVQGGIVPVSVAAPCKYSRSPRFLYRTKHPVMTHACPGGCSPLDVFQRLHLPPSNKQN